MNYFPTTGNFHAHLTVAPWLSIPTAVAVAGNLPSGGGPRGSSRRSCQSNGSTTDLQAASTSDYIAGNKPSAAAADPPDPPLPFASSMYIKSICNVHTGVGFIVSDLTDAWLGYFSPQNVMTQLAERMPGVTIEVVEALRMIERSVDSSSSPNGGGGGEGRMHFSIPTTTRHHTDKRGTSSSISGNSEDGGGGGGFAWNPAAGGTIHMESSLDLGLDDRAVPLKVHLSFTMVHVTRVVLVDPLQKTQQPAGTTTVPAGSGGTSDNNIVASFIRDQFILPLMAVSQGTACLVDNLVREGAKYHPQGYSGLSHIASASSITPMGGGTAAGALVLVKDALVESVSEVEAPGSGKANQRGCLVAIGRHPSHRAALETRFLGPGATPSQVGGPPSSSAAPKPKPTTSQQQQPAEGGGSKKTATAAPPVGGKRPRVDLLGADDSLPDAGIILDYLATGDDRPHKKHRVEDKGGGGGSAKLTASGGSPMQRTTSIYVETPDEIAQKKRLQEKLQLERVQQTQLKQKPLSTTHAKVAGGGTGAGTGAQPPRPTAPPVALKPVDDKIKKIRKALL